MSWLQLLVKPTNRNLLDVVSKLPQLGVGTRVTRDSWEQYQNSYWEVTKVKPRSPDGKLGKVWGVLMWRGERRGGMQQINGRAKKLWRWVPPQQDVERLQGLAAELRQLREWRRLAATQQAGATGSSGSS